MYRILIADRQTGVCKQLLRMPVLKNNPDFTILKEVQTGMEALELLCRDQVDVLITDIRLPIRDGWELLEVALREHLCKAVVLLSEFEDASHIQQARLFGAFDYLVKPVTNDMLEDLLDRLLTYLHAYRTASVFTVNEMKSIGASLLADNTLYLQTLSDITMRMRKEHPTPEKQLLLYRDMLSILERELQSQCPWMMPFLDKRALFSFLPKETPVLDWPNLFRDQIARLHQQLHKFAFPAKNELVRKVCIYILEQIENPEIHLQNVANHFFVNMSYLSHLFRKNTGTTYVAYVTFAKMERAAVLLKNTDQKIYEIAWRLGYDNPEYFGVLFKKHAGLSAHQYRLRHQTET